MRREIIWARERGRGGEREEEFLAYFFNKTLRFLFFFFLFGVKTLARMQGWTICNPSNIEGVGPLFRIDL